MTTTSPTILVLGGTGKTGRRLATRLARAGITVRTAARHDADTVFDWDDDSTHDLALDGVSGVYLVPPALDLSFPPRVGAFLERAERAGVDHVTLLSARGVDLAPPAVPLRAVELDLAGRGGLRHTVLRPSWFMQNFSEYIFLPGVLSGTLAVPTGDGAEAFVHVDDIVDVAVAALTDPDAHDGRGYTITGPEALTFAQVATQISTAVGHDVHHVDADRSEWIDTTVEAGVPRAYAEVLAGLFDIIRAGGGVSTSDDVETVTGHPARAFADYLADPSTASAWSAPVRA